MKQLLLLSCFFCFHSLAAQLFTEVKGLPFAGYSQARIQFVDVDNDGDEDVFISGIGPLGNAEQRVRFYENDGTGRFVTSTISGLGRATNWDLSDLDGDGDQDYFITAGVDFLIYRNDGTGSIDELIGNPIDPLYHSTVLFVDVDGDNDKDLLVKGLDYGRFFARLYLNDGSGNLSFVEDTPFQAVLSSQLGASDIDNDGDEDILITSNRSIRIYENTGGVSFTEMTDTGLDSICPKDVIFADMDGDSYEDLLCINIGNDSITKLYVNDGNGNFSELVNMPFENDKGYFAVSDVDGDNDQDLVVVGTINNESYIYENDGDGNFMLLNSPPFQSVSESAIAFSDMDNDGDQDALVTGNNAYHWPTTKQYENDGAGNFTEITPGPLFTPATIGSISFADVDNDDDQDMLLSGIGNYGVRISALYLNDGNGDFDYPIEAPFEPSFGSSTFIDVDGDNDQDVLITGMTAQGEKVARLYANDGAVNFTEVSGTPFEGVFRSALDFSDIDSDGDFDLLITGLDNDSVRTTNLYANDGTGGFTLVANTPFEAVSNGSVSFLDIDGDDDEDVILTGEVSDALSITRLYINDGTGNFAASTTNVFEGVYNSSIASADIDGDDDLDVVVKGMANDGYVTTLYVNDGIGNLAVSTAVVFDRSVRGDVAFTDVDNDNDPDLMVSGRTNNSSGIYINDGSGGFTQRADTLSHPFTECTLGFADVDGDDDEDFVIAGLWRDVEISLYLNNGLTSLTDEPTIFNFDSTLVDNNQDLQDFNMSLHPNPVAIQANELNVVFNTTNPSPINITILDLDGRVLQQHRKDALAGQQAFVIDITSLSAGSYFVRLDDGKREVVRKFLVGQR